MRCLPEAVGRLVRSWSSSSLGDEPQRCHSFARRGAGAPGSRRPGRAQESAEPCRTPSAGASSPPARSPSSFARDLRAGPRRPARRGRLADPASARGVRASEYGAAAAYGSYEELVADPAVEVVYVASPHALHLEHARLAFEAGKHVLCEKPLTLNVAEAEEMVGAGRRARAVPDGGDVDRLPPGGPRRWRERLARGPLRHAAPRCTPSSASSSTPAPRTGCSTRRWARARCSTWASTR